MSNQPSFRQGNLLSMDEKRTLHSLYRIQHVVCFPASVFQQGNAIIAWKQYYLISKSNIFCAPMYPSSRSPIRTPPTPAGVPVKIRSPVFNVMNVET